VELAGSSTSGRQTIDDAIHIERRRIFWQRVYSEVLARLIADLRPLGEYEEAGALVPECSGLAKAAADQAVRDFDAWEESQHASTPAKADPAGHEGDGDEDDPDDQYLGR
jgi:hypothetical protein